MIYIIGFLAQICFSARLLLQWLMSEKVKHVVSPTIFWILSLVGSYLLFIYGWLRNDFAILLGQLIAYYIYIWNLNMKNNWKKIPVFFRAILMLTPVFAIGYAISEFQEFLHDFFDNEKIPLSLLIYGSLGQITFTLRFVYQWFYSYQKNESLLPLGFWIISLSGAAIIISYAIIRRDPVLIIGQATGLIVYSRNIFLSCRENKKKAVESNAQS